MTSIFEWRRVAAAAALLVCALMSPVSATAQFDYTAWEDFGPIFPEAEQGDAYYPSVIFDRNGFGGGGPLYKLWFSDGSGAVFLITSADGFEWSAAEEIEGLGGNAHHVQVLYDADRFGDGGGSKYKMWYWDIDASLFDIATIGYAESEDGLLWADGPAMRQDDRLPLVSGVGGDWNSASYGPVCVMYQPDAPNRGRRPFHYRYVLYFNASDGRSEATGLAYSADGIYWMRHGNGPVLAGGDNADWDCDDAVYGTVMRDEAGYHYWYSGGGGNDGDGGCREGRVHEGIGVAHSRDGIRWEKDSQNPIFHIDDGVEHRTARAYTPAVVRDAAGSLVMFYSAQKVEGPKRIAMAALFPSVAVTVDIHPGLILPPGRFSRWQQLIRVCVLSTPEFDAVERVQRDTPAFGRSGHEESLAFCSRQPQDANSDGYEDLVCFFHRHRTQFECGDETGFLRGMTVDGYPLEGHDRVRLFPCRR